ncbi:hypothetical protein AB833_03365 [Chromatiales bacterium (ex Bugula neritina AB1)]|nr:hypothetical protein AB833_03365 [Chromatiales bacterium (ex Bugula neritina AB1)]
MSPVAVSEEVLLDSIIAVVNEDIILSSEFVRERATLIRQNPPNLPKGEKLDKAVIERLIAQSLQLQKAAERGIRIDDSSLQRTLEDMARNNKMTISQMRESLNRDGINFLEFRENIRKELVISALSQREIDSNLRVSDEEVEALLDAEAAGSAGYRYELEHILVKVPQQADGETVSTALAVARSVASDARDGIPFNRVLQTQIRSGYTDIEGGNLGSRSLANMPKLFADQVKGMQIGDITEPLRSAAGFHVLQLLTKSSLDQPATIRVRARHILVSTRDGTSASAAKERITAIYNRLSEGADFAALAREVSDDKSSAAKGGDLGWFGRDEMVPRFETLAFSTEPNQLTEPFFTEFGWHVMEVTEREVEENPRSDLEARARDQLRRRKAEDKYDDWLAQLRANAYVELRGFAKNFQ